MINFDKTNSKCTEDSLVKPAKLQKRICKNDFIIFP